jgi:membrane-associated phospholipid phosphatase
MNVPAGAASRRRDRVYDELSRAADRGALWLGVGGLLVAAGGRRRRAGVSGLVAVMVTSTLVNGPIKLIFRRQRPSHDDDVRHRLVRPPRTSSFPSGHAASAFAFATGAAMEAPELTIPLALLAAGVARSRVYTRVHHRVDVVAGSAVGVALAVGTRRVAARLAPAARERRGGG